MKSYFLFGIGLNKKNRENKNSENRKKYREQGLMIHNQTISAHAFHVLQTYRYHQPCVQHGATA